MWRRNVCGGSQLIDVPVVTFTGSSARDKRSEGLERLESSGGSKKCLFYCLWVGGHVGCSGHFVCM